MTASEYGSFRNQTLLDKAEYEENMNYLVGLLALVRIQPVGAKEKNLQCILCQCDGLKRLSEF